MLGFFVLVYFVISGHWRLLCLDGPGSGQPTLSFAIGWICGANDFPLLCPATRLRLDTT